MSTCLCQPQDSSEARESESVGVEEECVHKSGDGEKRERAKKRYLLFRSTKTKDTSEISPAYLKAYKNLSKKSSTDH